MKFPAVAAVFSGRVKACMRQEERKKFPDVSSGCERTPPSSGESLNIGTSMNHSSSN